MAPVTSLLASTLLFASLTLAAPVQNEVALATNKKSMLSTARASIDGKKNRRARIQRVVARARRKREVFVEEEPEEDSVDQQLAQLSDDQLALLADIVQQKLDQYDPNLPLESYRIVELPDEMFVNQLEDEEDPYDEEVLVPTRPRRSETSHEPVIVIPEDDLENMIEEHEQVEEQPQVMLVPEESMEEVDQVVPVSNEVLDELELRERIAEMATILNERAYRGL